MMSLLVCTDANLTLKLVLQEADTGLARALWEQWNTEQTIVIAPNL